ncbi:AAA domain-containing protein [Clostridium tetanomorphum]|uniref:AAA family ATPase n=1 Tax=Clostridium tetanomorphum TaxID=1553 RepID=A0A923EB97_CLOTT|nr:AAA domain-containing protein [Clostridium tetanomorphum]MBC2399913.1 AAA family ATPase [Clostridium tetanomorphum]NRZ99487.1 superfamily I DNA and/or RNA helicase [Clostridium tetanomorphum]
METRDKVKKLFEYLINLKGVNEKIIINIKEYDKIFWQKDIENTKGCTINKDSNFDWWIKVSKSAKNIYSYLFNLYQDIQKKGERLELVYGNGMVNWKEINHPIFIVPLELNFDIEEGEFFLKPSGNINLESYFLQGLNIDYSRLIKLKEEIKSQGIDLRETKILEEYCYKIMDILSTEEICLDNKDPYKTVEQPSINMESVFFVRKSSTNLWKEEIKSILDELDNGLEIPKTMEALVNKDILLEDEELEEQWREISKDLLFPLSANEEQKEIAKRVSDNFGVVVQGPPGTGKSHTIANLICHFLAHGKTVLVTSETDRALKVLEEKIPEEIRDLCISLLGNDVKSFQKLEESVRRITDKLSLNPVSVEKELKVLRKDLNDCRSNQKILTEKLKGIDKKGTQSIKYFGQDYNLIEIAKWLKENEKDYSWIEDEIKPYSKAPICESDFNKLINYCEKIKKEDIKSINEIGPIIDKIPSYMELYNKINEYIKLKEKYNVNLDYIKGWNIYDDKRFQYEKLINLLDIAECKLDNIEKGGFYQVLVDYYTSGILKESISGMLMKWNGYVKRIAMIKKELNNHSIQIEENIDLNHFENNFNIIYEELNKRGKIGKLFFMIHKECIPILEKCTVDYKPIESLPQAVIVKLYLEEKFIERNILNLWNNTFRLYNNLKIKNEYGKNNLVVVEKYMKIVTDIVNWNEKFKLEAIKLLGRIQFPINMDWNKKDTLYYMRNCVNIIKEIYLYKDTQAYLQSIKNLIYSNKELALLFDSIEELNLEKLKDAFLEVERLKRIKLYVCNMNSILSKLNHMCPKLCLKILSGEVSNLKNWNRAWRWREWNSMLEELQTENQIELEEKLENEKEKEKVLIREVVYKQTWYNQILNISENEKRSLFSWLQAVKRIGKGKGKHTWEYIKLAQREIENCKEFIPVWVMPMNRVIENIKVTSKKFDVVIIDESSQSNIFSLCALMRAKKAIVVGDDKQISPEAIGVEQESVKNLINIYLKDIPNKEWFDLQTSLYDTALRVFPSRVTLKEHFRCVPELIEFSNRVCYSGDIIPLRYAEKFKRFEPSIQAIRIYDGKREGKKGINIEEAKAIVEKIKECCKDKKYRGMSIGVISLLGEAQGDYIQELLRNEIGEEEIIKRKIICGDAYSFQGDERDIMFLSMVIGDNMKYTALTKESDIRRFNVAASRAKNQMWLFYSIEPENLSRECIRFALLDYCINYNNYQKDNKSINYVFYSELQRDVYKLLIEKGYNIYTNINIGGYILDFVIEGFRNKAAIMCENQSEDLSPTWDESYESQLKLKSCGWQIIKIRGLNFYRDEHKVMNKIFYKLEKLGILPCNESEGKCGSEKLYKNSKELKVV